MVKHELRQVFYLSREVEMWEAELVRVRAQIFKASRKDPTSEIAANIVDIEQIIKGKLAEIQLERKRILDYIMTLDDSLMRQIFFYRYVACMGWSKIAREIGGANTADSVRKAHDRFLKAK